MCKKVGIRKRHVFNGNTNMKHNFGSCARLVCDKVCFMHLLNAFCFSPFLFLYDQA
jgi:hypothetical protein